MLNFEDVFFTPCSARLCSERSRATWTSAWTARTAGRRAGKIKMAYFSRPALLSCAANDRELRGQAHGQHVRPARRPARLRWLCSTVHRRHLHAGDHRVGIPDRQRVCASAHGGALVQGFYNLEKHCQAHRRHAGRSRCALSLVVDIQVCALTDRRHHRCVLAVPSRGRAGACCR